MARDGEGQGAGVVWWRQEAGGRRQEAGAGGGTNLANGSISESLFRSETTRRVSVCGWGLIWQQGRYGGLISVWGLFQFAQFG